MRCLKEASSYLVDLLKFSIIITIIIILFNLFIYLHVIFRFAVAM